MGTRRNHYLLLFLPPRLLLSANSTGLAGERNKCSRNKEGSSLHLQAQPFSFFYCDHQIIQVCIQNKHQYFWEMHTIIVSEYRSLEEVWVNDEHNILISWGENWRLRFSETAELIQVAPHYTCRCTEKWWAYQNILKYCQVWKALGESLFLIKNRFQITYEFDRIHMIRERIPTNL